MLEQCYVAEICIYEPETVHNADIVVMIVDQVHTFDNVNGIARMNTELNGQFAHAVIDWRGLPINVLTHEVGHILGLDENHSDSQNVMFQECPYDNCHRAAFTSEQVKVLNAAAPIAAAWR